MLGPANRRVMTTATSHSLFCNKIRPLAAALAGAAAKAAPTNMLCQRLQQVASAGQASHVTQITLMT